MTETKTLEKKKSKIKPTILKELEILKSLKNIKIVLKKLLKLSNMKVGIFYYLNNNKYKKEKITY